MRVILKMFIMLVSVLPFFMERKERSRGNIVISMPRA